MIDIKKTKNIKDNGENYPVNSRLRKKNKTKHCTCRKVE